MMHPTPPSRRTRPIAARLILLGLALLFTGLLIGVSHPAQAQPAETATYIGSEACAECHENRATDHARTAHALTLTAPDAETMRADFTAGEAERTVQFPGEGTPRAFTEGDVAFVIGSGQHVERFVYNAPDGTAFVLPVSWNVRAKRWEAYPLADVWPDPAFDWVQNCAGCHTTGMDFAARNWQERGVQCEACHGPGSVHAELAKNEQPSEAELIAMRAALVVTTDAAMCGSCHSAGADVAHGVPYPVDYQPGSPLSPERFTVFTDTGDTVHWRSTGQARRPAMQYNEWLGTSHGNALTSLRESTDADPACLRCHSADYRLTERLIAAHSAGTRAGAAPEPLTVERATQGVTCVGCHEIHPADGRGEVNSLIDEPYELCVSCHSDDDSTDDLHHPVQEIYEGEALVPEVTGAKTRHFTLKAGPKCSTCHMPVFATGDGARASHTMQFIFTKTLDQALIRKSCLGCHTNSSPQLMQKLVNDTMNKNQRRVKAARALLTENTPAWVKAVLDAVESDGSWGLHNPRYVASLLTVVERELKR